MENGNSCSSKLSVCNLATSIGIVWGGLTFLLAILTIVFQIGMPVIKLYGSIYVGYEASFVGAICGLFWGFINGFIVGGLIALVYNFCHCHCPCKNCKESRCCK